MNTEISLVCVGLTCQTAGLLRQIGYEVSATVDSPLLLAECEDFVKSIADYVAAGNAIQNGETVKYGNVILKKGVTPISTK